MKPTVSAAANECRREREDGTRPNNHIHMNKPRMSPTFSENGFPPEWKDPGNKKMRAWISRCEYDAATNGCQCNVESVRYRGRRDCTPEPWGVDHDCIVHHTEPAEKKVQQEYRCPAGHSWACTDHC